MPGAPRGGGSDSCASVLCRSNLAAPQALAYGRPVPMTIALKKELQREGRVALWIYAPGYLKHSPAVENMSDLTGFGFAKNEHPWPSFLYITNFTHPITEGLSQDLFWGSDSRLAPQFRVQDSEAEVLGQVVYAQGTCQPGFAVESFPHWTSIYSCVLCRGREPAFRLRVI